MRTSPAEPDTRDDEPAPARRRLPCPSWLLVGAVALFALSLYLRVSDMLTWPVHRAHMVDLGVYYSAGQELWDNTELYTKNHAGLPFLYSPFAALFASAMTLLPMGSVPWVMTGLSVVAVLVAIWCAWGIAGFAASRGRLALTLAVGAVALHLEPIQSNISFGQVNALLMGLVVLDFALPKENRFKGVALGLAASVKLIPGVFILYLLLTGRVRAGLTALGTFAATIAIGTAFLPVQSAQFWTGGFADSSRMGAYLFWHGNQSINGMVGQAFEFDQPALHVTRLALSAVFGVVGLLVATRFGRRGLELPGLLMTALTALLVSPISWHHHWVWVAPFLVLLISQAMRPTGPRRTYAAAAVSLVLVTACWPDPYAKEPPGSVGVIWWGVPESDAAFSTLDFIHSLYTICGVVAFLVIAVATLLPRRGEAGSALR
ncbi:glycosyltransferase 87 family protein [Allokutzneria sp. A3M-2-11 16]|uniref:glycosyltransferase 87 family protein n=1 Tax=Allokutzneria sp. A3M-2-11 16 TaxID=2962043 RepID=UPI0020B6B332|nr:glycosyltransferase 87 family protein [Allokutzneria sp. A3M-2-11 16]MCP3802816.1 glycosyltransferase 87 family protein [Allokutzneria sp. A3M-2-11 16]